MAASGIGSSSLVEQVQDALTHLDDPTYLQTHPLARLAPTLGASRESRQSRALRHSLEEGIEALKPTASTSELSHGWRGYELLRLRYLEGLDVRSVAERLSISRSEYYRDHRRAVEAVAGILRERWGVGEGGEGSTGATDAAESRLVEPAIQTRGGREVVGSLNNLPHQLTSFVGREQQVAEVRRLVGEHRLVTLTGAGGSGKTRLALEVARGLLEDRPEEYPDGVFLVEFASLADPTLVPQTVSSSLGVRDRPDRPILQTLQAYLRTRRLLLVLDNCEHLVEAAASLADALLRACPHLRILSTSRELLAVTGELVWHVPPLSLPDSQQPLSLEHLMDSEAVCLFVERAALVQPGFVATARNAPFLGQIVWRLDGMPLAIELAAAMTRGRSLEEISKHLDDRLHLLTRGSRVAPPRQQTLRATIDWSYDLLTEPERTLFRRLAVFAGGFTLEAVERVCSGQDVGIFEVHDLLTSLVDKSLVQADVRERDSRYRLLEPIRQYSQERLEEAGWSTALKDKHRDWYVALAARAEPGLLAASLAARDQLMADYPNLRSALEWCLVSDVECGLRLAGILWHFWWQVTLLGEGHRWLEALLARAEGLGVERARALLGSAFLSRFRDSDRARQLTEESLSLFRQAGDKMGAGWALHLLGMLALNCRDLPDARRQLSESAAVFEEIGFAPGVGMDLRDLGQMALHEGDQHRARALLEESLSVLRPIGGWQLAQTLVALGALTRDQGDYPRARTLLADGLVLNRQWGSWFQAATTLCHIACLARLEGDAARARELTEESLTSYRQLGGEVEGHTPFALWSYGLLAIERGASERGTRLLGVATSRFPFYHLEPGLTEAALASSRSVLGEEAFARAWSEGQAMTLEQAVEYALGEEDDAQALG